MQPPREGAPPRWISRRRRSEWTRRSPEHKISGGSITDVYGEIRNRRRTEIDDSVGFWVIFFSILFWLFCFCLPYLCYFWTLFVLLCCIVFILKVGGVGGVFRAADRPCDASRLFLNWTVLATQISHWKRNRGMFVRCQTDVETVEGKIIGASEPPSGGRFYLFFIFLFSGC